MFKEMSSPCTALMGRRGAKNLALAAATSEETR